MTDPFLQDLWRRSAGLPEKYTHEIQDYQQLKKSEWNCEFEKLMRNRLQMGVYRGYGLLESPDKPQWNRVKRAITELQEYEKPVDGNIERLVDAANMLMLEYAEGNHPNRHFSSRDDVGHTELK